METQIYTSNFTILYGSYVYTYYGSYKPTILG